VNPPIQEGPVHGVGTTLTTLAGGGFAVAEPLFDVFTLGTVYPDDGRVWYGDSNGLVRADLNSPGGFTSFLERGYAASLSVLPNGGLLVGAPRFYGGSGFTGWITNMGAVYRYGTAVYNPDNS